MARKIKIGQLPPGYHMMPDGRIMRDSDHMQYGGNTLRDVGGQGDFNLEAEGGETIVTDKTGDGFPEHYAINGKRHHQGGVKMNESSNSFIFSDTPKMKLGKELNNFFNKPENKAYTPAEIAKQYLDMNDDKRTMYDPFADNLERTTAGLNMFNKMYKLGGLAIAQEAKKGMPDGIPVIAQMYAQLNGMASGENTMPAGMQQAKYGAQVAKYQDGSQIYRKDVPIYVGGKRYYYQSTEDAPGLFTGDTVTLFDPVSKQTIQFPKDAYDKYAGTEGIYMPSSSNIRFPEEYYQQGLPDRIYSRPIYDFGFSAQQSADPAKFNKFKKDGREYLKGQTVYFNNQPYVIENPFGYTKGLTQPGQAAAGVGFAPPNVLESAGPALIVRPMEITYDAQGNPITTPSRSLGYIPVSSITDENYSLKPSLTGSPTAPSQQQTPAKPKTTTVGQAATPNISAPSDTIVLEEFEEGGPVKIQKKQSGNIEWYEYKGKRYDTREAAIAAREADNKSAASGGTSLEKKYLSGLNEEQRAAYMELKQYAPNTYIVNRNGKLKAVVSVSPNASYQDKNMAAGLGTMLGYDNMIQPSTDPKLKTKGAGNYYGGISPTDYEQKIVSVYDGVDATQMDPKAVRKRMFEIMGLDATQEQLDADANTLYGDKDWVQNQFYPAFTKLLPEGEYRADLGDDFNFGLEHLDAIKPKTPPPPGETPDPESEYWCTDNGIVATPKGSTKPEGYKRGPFSTAESAEAYCQPDTPGVPPPKNPPPGQPPFIQDRMAVAASLAMPINKYPSWAPTIDAPWAAPVFEDPRYVNAAIQGTAQQAMEASNAFAGNPSVARATNAMYQAQSGDAQIKNISGVGQRNVGIANQFSLANAANALRSNLANAQMQKQRYDQNIVSADNYDKERGLNLMQNIVPSMQNLVTNRAMAASFPRLFPQFMVDTRGTRGGIIDFTDAYAKNQLNPRSGASTPTWEQFQQQYPGVSKDELYKTYAKMYLGQAPENGVTSDSAYNMLAMLSQMYNK